MMRLLPFVLFGLVSWPNVGMAQEFMIRCQGNTVSKIFDGRAIEVFENKPDVQSFKIGPNSINSKKCAVSTDQLLICSRPKTQVAGGTGELDLAYIQTSEQLDRYTGKMVSTSRLYFVNGMYRDEVFEGFCEKSKKRF